MASAVSKSPCRRAASAPVTAPSISPSPSASSAGGSSAARSSAVASSAIASSAIASSAIASSAIASSAIASSAIASAPASLAATSSVGGSDSGSASSFMGAEVGAVGARSLPMPVSAGVPDSTAATVVGLGDLAGIDGLISGDATVFFTGGGGLDEIATSAGSGLAPAPRRSSVASPSSGERLATCCRAAWRSPSCFDCHQMKPAPAATLARIARSDSQIAALPCRRTGRRGRTRTSGVPSAAGGACPGSSAWTGEGKRTVAGPSGSGVSGRRGGGGIAYPPPAAGFPEFPVPPAAAICERTFSRACSTWRIKPSRAA